MGNEFGELPFFACHGMLARTHAVQRVLGVEKEWNGRPGLDSTDQDESYESYVCLFCCYHLII